MTKAIRNKSITIINHGIFSVKSKNSNDTYTVCFGDDENMPSCSYPAWSELYYPCKHFFSIFEKVPLWSWEHLSSYTNSPFLNLYNEKEEKFVNDVNNEAIEQYEKTAIDNDILNNNNDSIADGKIELDNQSDEESISRDCKMSLTSPSHCREKLVTIRNLMYDIHNEHYSVFDKVNKYLESVLYLLRNATKKEISITVRPKKDANRFESKRRIVDIPKKRAAKIPKRVGFANSKKAEAAKLTISKKMKEEQNNVIEEGVVNDIKMDNVTSLATNIPVYQIFEIESDDEKVDEKPLPRSTYT